MGHRLTPHERIYRVGQIKRRHAFFVLLKKTPCRLLLAPDSLAIDIRARYKCILYYITLHYIYVTLNEICITLLRALSSLCVCVCAKIIKLYTRI